MDDRSVLAALAVFGREVPALWVAATVAAGRTGSMGPSVERLIAAGILAPALPGSPLLRLARPREAAAYEAALPASERARLHAAAARVLTRREGRRSAVELAEIARHVRHGPVTPQAIAAHRAAATACLATGLIPLAAEAFEWLGERTRTLRPSQRLHLRLDWAKCLHALGRPRESALRLREAWNDRALRNDPISRATLAGALAAQANAAGHHGAALKWTVRAGRSSVMRRARGLSARLGAQRAFALWGLGRVDEAADEVRSALRAVPEGAQETRRDLWSLAGTIAFGRKQLDAAATAEREALRLAERLRDRPGVARISANLAMTEDRRGRRALAIRLLERALRLFRDAGMRECTASILNSLGRLRYLAGDLARARAVLDEALAQAELAGDARTLAGVRLHLGAVRRCSGDLVGARRLLEQMRESAGRQRRGMEAAIADGNLAWIDIEMGRTRGAHLRIVRARRRFESLRDPEGIAFCERMLAHAAELAGDIDEMRRAVDRGRSVAARAGIELLDRQLAVAGAIAHFAPARREEAFAALRTARQHFSSEGYFPGLLEAERREAQICLLSGDAPAARDRFRAVRRRARLAGFALEAVRARVGEALSARSSRSRRRLLAAARREASRLPGAKALREEIRRAGRVGTGSLARGASLDSATAARMGETSLRAHGIPHAPPIPAPPRTRGRPLQPRPFRFRPLQARPGLDDVEIFEGMVGRSPAMKMLFRELERLNDYGGPVLIEGETGAGKELLAAAVHRRGPRARGPLVPIACAAIPESLLESEVFGVAAGAFTGASADRPGLWVQADGGDLLLDDLQDFPPRQQSKLLRVLESGEVRAVGSTVARRVDVRVIATVNRPIAELVERGQLRKALFYRLGAVVLRLPPLRERPMDLPALAACLLERSARAARRAAPPVTPGAFEALALHSWPGNVRELEGFLERLRLSAEGRPLNARLVEAEVASHREAPAPAVSAAPPGRLREALSAVRDSMIRRALRLSRGSIPHAAESLGITRQALHRYLRDPGRPGLPGTNRITAVNLD